MSQRFFVESPIVTELVQLEGPEAHHLIHVMRAQPGEHVVLFDGGGAEFPALIERIGRKHVELRVLSRHEWDRELAAPLVLAVALPRGDRQDWLVEKAVELGVNRLVPLQTERSVARPTDRSIQRLRRAVIEASKQCGRNRLMAIDSPCSFAAYIERRTGATSLLAHPCASSEPAATDLLAIARSAPRPEGLSAAIGPEGGFSDFEVRQAVDAGWILVDLGRRTLRTETAALALAAIFAASNQH
jgi:16S rRNA (uracil1498-N3)-methyltransferase